MNMLDIFQETLDINQIANSAISVTNENELTRVCEVNNNGINEEVYIFDSFVFSLLELITI